MKYFGLTGEEIERVIEAVGAALRDRILTRDQLADVVAKRTGSELPR